MSEDVTTGPMSPFERLGGHATMEAICNRFYDLMDGDPAYAELRAMHAPDLAQMRKSLPLFLAGWSGGPREWFEANPGRCMMSLHRPFRIDAKVAGSGRTQCAAPLPMSRLSPPTWRRRWRTSWRTWRSEWAGPDPVLRRSERGAREDQSQGASTHDGRAQQPGLVGESARGKDDHSGHGFQMSRVPLRFG